MNLDYAKVVGMDTVCRVDFEIQSELCEATRLYSMQFATVLLTVHRYGYT